MLTTSEKLSAKQDANATLQRMVNDLTPEQVGIGEAERLIKAIAYAAHAEYPQYMGHWEGWKLVRVRHTIRTKLGVAFRAGDLALMDEEEETFFDDAYSVYSIRNGADTVLDAKHING